MTDGIKQSSNSEVATTDEKSTTNLEKASASVKSYVKGSMALALLPFPFVDMVLLTGVQLKMLKSLSDIYGVKFSKELGKSTLGSLAGGVLPSTIGMGIASSLKFLPIVGTVVGIASTSVLAGATTYAVGKVFIQHFESGGTFLNFDPEKVRDYFSKEFEHGKQVAASLKDTVAA